MLHLTPKPYDPPKEFWYYHDGETVGHFAFGEQPDGMDFLMPALRAEGAAKVKGTDGNYVTIDDEARKVLAAIERYFRVSIPREDVLSGTLPGAVTAMAPPNNPGD